MYDRRELLKYAGSIATAATVGLSGCLEVLATRGEDDGPEYVGRLGTDDEWVSFGYVDWDEVTTVTQREGDFENGHETNLVADELMHDYPLDGVAMLVERLDAELAGPGLGELLRPYPAIGTIDDEADDGTTDEYESTVEDVLLINEAIVLSGSIDVDEITDGMAETPDGNTLRREYEQSNDLREYGIYTPADGEFRRGNPTVAISDEAIVFAEGEAGIDPITGAIETAHGSGERATSAIEEFNWLIEYAGAGHIVFGGYGEDPSFDPSEHWGNTDSLAKTHAQFDQAKGAVSSITFDDEETISGAIAAYYVGIDESFEAELKGRLASTATERSIAVNTDENRVRATAAWGGAPESDDGNESEDD